MKVHARVEIRTGMIRIMGLPYTVIEDGKRVKAHCELFKLITPGNTKGSATKNLIDCIVLKLRSAWEDEYLGDFLVGCGFKRETGYQWELTDTYPSKLSILNINTRLIRRVRKVQTHKQG